MSGELTVYAAASLHAAFDALARAFTTAYPAVTVKPIVYDGSSTLATQIVQGAPADVFASADEKTMATVTSAGLASDPRPFARNTLVVVVPHGNPGNVNRLADLGKSGVSVVLCAPAVPCGSASQRLLAAQGVSVTPVSQEQSVTAVLTKIDAGAADAGLVYATDAAGDRNVDSFVPEGADRIVNMYPIVALSGAKNPQAAAAWVTFVLSERGQQILRSFGFGAP